MSNRVPSTHPEARELMNDLTFDRHRPRPCDALLATLPPAVPR